MEIRRCLRYVSWIVFRTIRFTSRDRRWVRARVAALMFASLTFLASVTAYGALKAAPTERNFVDIDQMMNKAVSDGNIPGGVVLIGHHGKVVYRKAFGARALEPVNEPMTVDTIFDLASLTKCIATTTSMMKLIHPVLKKTSYNPKVILLLLAPIHPTQKRLTKH